VFLVALSFALLVYGRSSVVHAWAQFDSS